MKQRNELAGDLSITARAGRTLVHTAAPAVDLAARILKLLARSTSSQATLSEISVALGAPKSTCSRVLSTLEAHELVRHDPRSRRFSLGVYNVLLGSRAEAGLDHMSVIRGILDEVSSTLGLTAVFAQRIDDRMVYVAKQDPPTGHAVSVSVGNRFPITETSIGLWALAYAPPDDRARLLGGTAIDPDLQAHLSTIIGEGVLVSRGEYIAGISMVSSPLLDHERRLIGVLAVLDTMPSLVGDDVDVISTTVSEAAEGVVLGA